MPQRSAQAGYTQHISNSEAWAPDGVRDVSGANLTVGALKSAALARKRSKHFHASFH
jgi:hypothetical protein